MPEPLQITRSRMIKGRVSSNTALTSRLYSLRFETELLPFEPGQFVRLELTIDGEKIAKPYSLVNVPDDRIVELFFNTVPGGLLSNSLANLGVGDSLCVSQPAIGFFTINNTPVARDLWMIATGTGLGPYLSILRTERLWKRFEKVVLVHGVPLREELAYQNIIKLVQDKHTDSFQYFPCVSREGTSSGFRGRITEVFNSGQLELGSGLRIDQAFSSVMLCGNHNMIDDMQALLGERGLRKHLRHAPGQIITEQYF